MKLGYYIPQLRCRQVKQSGKVVGSMLLLHYSYGYKVQYTRYDRSPMLVNEKIFPEQWKAEQYFDRMYQEVSEK